MTFQDIFKEKGTYKAESFTKGFCFGVDDEGWLYSLDYSHKDDVNPKKGAAQISRDLITKNFVKVFNRNQLFE